MKKNSVGQYECTSCNHSSLQENQEKSGIDLDEEDFAPTLKSEIVIKTEPVQNSLEEQTANEVCFTRESLDELGLIRVYDEIHLNQSLLVPGSQLNLEVKVRK